MVGQRSPYTSSLRRVLLYCNNVRNHVEAERLQPPRRVWSPDPHERWPSADDEAWHVREATLRFRFADRKVDAEPDATVFVPAGVPHAYETIGTARYLISLTPRLNTRIVALPGVRDLMILRRYESEILE